MTDPRPAVETDVSKEIPPQSPTSTAASPSTPSSPSSPSIAQTQFAHQRHPTETTLCQRVDSAPESKLTKGSSVSLRNNDRKAEPETSARAASPSSSDANTGESENPGCWTAFNLWAETLNDRWIWEMLSCVLAVACLICIVSILAVYEDHPLPELPELISINSLVAVFTAIMKAAMMVPVSQGVSQLKWLWFSKPRSLADMDDFDNASRGPWGSFLLMLSLRKHYLASFGAFIAVVVLAIDPFSQQILHFYPCYDVEPSSVARIPRSNNFTEGGQLTTQFNAELYGPMQAAIYHAVLRDRIDGSASSLVDFDCRSGNCTFPQAEDGSTFQTLGMCHACSDISGEINRNTSYPGYWLPQGSDGVSTTRIGYVYAVKEQPWTVLNTKCTLPSMDPMEDLVQWQVLMMTHNTTATACGPESGPSSYNGTAGSRASCLGRPTAMTCSLYPCVRTYSAEIRAGVLRESVLSSTPLRKTNASDPNVVNSTTSLTFSLATDRTLRSGAWHICKRSDRASALTPVAINAVNNTLALPRTSSSPMYTEPDCVWELAYSSALAINRFVATLFDKTVISDTSTQLSATQGPLWLKNMYQDGHATLESIDAFVGSLADAITSTLRQPRAPSPTYQGPDSAGDDGGDTTHAHGAVVVAQTCVAVRWEWLTLPSTLIAMTIGFLVATVVRCVRTGTFHGAWRSSSLAPFFHGIDPRTRAGLGEVGRQSEMVDAAKGIKVKVVPRGPRGENGQQGLEVVTVIARRGTFATTSSV